MYRFCMYIYINVCACVRVCVCTQPHGMQMGNKSKLLTSCYPWEKVYWWVWAMETRKIVKVM